MFDAWLDPWLDLAHGATCAACLTPGRLLCKRCELTLPTTGHEVRPDPCPEGLARAFAAGEYAGPLRDLLLAHKEHRAFALARPIGQVLAGVLAPLVGVPTVLVPVPSRPSVVRMRGHDPMLRMTRVAASRLRSDGHDVRVSEVLRHRDVVADQAGLDTRARSANLADSMGVHLAAVRSLGRLDAVAAVICDDVLTTGATAREAQRALEVVGVRVRAIACVAATRKRHPTRSVAV